MAKKTRIPHKFLPWIEARKKFGLSHKHVQMARELGLSPKKFGGYADRRQQPWKLPLPQFIEFLYERQFKKAEPEQIQTMEEIAAQHVAKRAEKKATKPQTLDENPADNPADNVADNSVENRIDNEAASESSCQTEPELSQSERE